MENKISFTILETIAAAFILLVSSQVLAIPVLGVQFLLPQLSHLTIPLAYAVGFIGAIVLIKLWKGFTWQQIWEFFTARLSIVSFFLSILIFASILPFVEFTTSLFPTSGLGGLIDQLYKIFISLFESMFEYKIAAAITVCILAPILEELFFRGILLQGMFNQKVNPVVAIVVTSILFGVVHMNPWQFIAATLIGMVLGFIYWRTKSLMICIFLHALNNSISTFLYLKYDSEMEEINLVNQNQPEYYVYILVGIILCVVFGYGLFRITKTSTNEVDLRHE